MEARILLASLLGGSNRRDRLGNGKNRVAPKGEETLRLTVLLVAVIGFAGCQGPAQIRSGEDGSEELQQTPGLELEERRERTAPSPNLARELRRALAQQALEGIDRAESESFRFPPEAFTDLPADVIADLERRGCTIPQVWLEAERSNVVRGRFTSSDQTDIAVLCSVERVSSILIFRGSSTSDIAEVAPSPDRVYLEFTGEGIGFARMIGVATQQFIRDHYEAYGGPEPPPLDHDGIDDAIVEKSSKVWYWYDGEWLRLTGSD